MKFYLRSSSSTNFKSILTVISERKCHFYFIFELFILIKQESAGTCSSHSFGCSTERILLSSGQLHFYRNNFLCYSVEIKQKRLLKRWSYGAQFSSDSIRLTGLFSSVWFLEGFRFQPRNVILQAKFYRITDSWWQFCEYMRSPSDVIRLIILQNSFVFLALFLALVLKERRVSTSPVFTQNLLFKK